MALLFHGWLLTYFYLASFNKMTIAVQLVYQGFFLCIFIHAAWRVEGRFCFCFISWLHFQRSVWAFNIDGSIGKIVIPSACCLKMTAIAWYLFALGSGFCLIKSLNSLNSSFVDGGSGGNVRTNYGRNWLRIYVCNITWLCLRSEVTSIVRKIDGRGEVGSSFWFADPATRP